MRTENTLRNAKMIVAAIALLLLASQALALGVGPSRSMVYFEPGAKINGTLFIINDAGQAFKAAVYAEGPFSENVKIKKPLLDVASTEGMKEVQYEIEFPNTEAKPGEHKLELVVRQFPQGADTEGTTVSATMAVISQLIIMVPYPGKYAEGKLFINGAEEPNSTATFTISLQNFGTENIVAAKAKIEIFGPTWEKLAEFYTDEKPIKSKDTGKIEAQWKPDVNKGSYVARATVYYDGKEFKIEQGFNVGTFMIDVSDISVKKFTLGDVAKFDITLLNSWNTEIKDVYVEMTVEDSSGKKMTEFKTAAIAVQAQKEGTLEAYWYTEGVMPGIYKVRLLIHYAGKLVQREYDFEVSTNSITKLGAVGQAITQEEVEEVTSKGLIILLIIITLVLLIGMNIAWFYKLNRLMKGKQGGAQ